MLLDVDMGGTSSTDAHMNMIGSKELGSQLLEALRESRGEQQVAMVAISVGIWPMLVAACCAVENER